MVRKRLSTFLVPIIAAGLLSGCRSQQTRNFWPFSGDRRVAHQHSAPFGHGPTVYGESGTPQPLIAAPDSHQELATEPSEHSAQREAGTSPAPVDPPQPQTFSNAPREIPEPPTPAVPPSEPAPPGTDPFEVTGDPIAALEELGGTIEFDEDGNPLAVNLADTEFGDREARLLEDLTTLHRVDLSGTRVTQAGLVHLRSLTQLQMLLLNHTNVSDRGLRHLEPMTKLRFLGLTHTPITDAGLVHLETLVELEYLLLSYTRVTARGLHHLKRLDRLQGLSLVGTEIADGELTELKDALPGCRFLTDAPPQSESLPAPSLENREPMDVPYQEPEDTEGSNPFDTSDSPHVPRTLDHGPTFEVPPAPEERMPELDEGEPALEGTAPGPESITPPELDERGPGLPVEREHATLPDSGAPLRNVIAQIADDVSALQRLANAYGAQGRWRDAATVLRAAWRRDPTDRAVQYNLAVALAHSGQIAAARPHFVATVGEAAADYNLGLILHELGRLPESADRFAAALRRQPDFAAARTWLNEVHKEQQTVKNLTAMKVLTDGMSQTPTVKPVTATKKMPALRR